MILPFFLLGLGVLTTIITLILWLRWKPSVISEVPEMIWPKVSVLVPARDEEQNLPRCLNALLASDYPLDRIEILVGDDHSTDNTRKVIQNYAAEHPQVSLVEVGHSSGNARAKANVLVYLTRAATHDIWLLTDADIAPSPGWLKAMVGVREREQAGLVAGVTMVESKSLWGQLQKVDWMMGWGMIQLGVEAGQPVTSAGNNMLVTREAYQAVGGYEKLPFSVTEDFVLYHAIIKEGYRVYHEFSSISKVNTLPIKGTNALLRQRKRWMKGGVTLPLWLVSPLVLQALYYPTIVGLFVLKPTWALPILFSKWFFQVLFIRGVAQRVGEKVSPFYLWAYEIYSSFLSTTMIIYYLWPAPIRWKGRKL